MNSIKIAIILATIVLVGYSSNYTKSESRISDKASPSEMLKGIVMKKEHPPIDMFDRVRIRIDDLTQEKNVAGLVGTIYGITLAF